MPMYRCHCSSWLRRVWRADASSVSLLCLEMLFPQIEEQVRSSPVFRVSHTLQQRELQLLLNKKTMKWHDAFQSTAVDLTSDFDSSQYEHRGHRLLGKRQSPTTTSAESSRTPSMVSFPTSQSLATPSALAINEPINQQFLNQVIMPPPIPLANQILYVNRRGEERSKLLNTK